MPTFRADLRKVPPYSAGRPLTELAAELGLHPSEVAKLALNESPLPPLPEVREAMSRMAGEMHRYPDADARQLRTRLAALLEVGYDEVWIGAGSSELLRVISMAVGGPGTSAVYAWPSFVIYRFGAVMAMAERIEVPLDRHGRHDLEAMLAAIRPDTTIVSICNPNNPTGTVLPAVDIAAFVEEVPERVLVVVDEAYHEYVSDPVHATAVPLAVERPNLIVTRTFSKIYGLAALRVGYAVSRAATVAELRKAQAPFTVSTMAQDAALESLAHEASMRQRAAEIVAERTRLEAVLAGRSLEFVPSQANFVSFRLGAPTAETSEAFLRHGVILRAFGDGWVRVTVGTPGENDRFLEAFENEHDRLRSGPVPADFG